MEAFMLASAATQIVTSTTAAVAAPEQASRNLGDAPRRIRSLGDFFCELESLCQRLKQKHVYRLHNLELDEQIQSLNEPLERLRSKISEARNEFAGSNRI